MANKANSGQLPNITKLPEDRNNVSALVGDSQRAFIASDSGNVFKSDF